MKNRTILYQDESGDLGLNGSDYFISSVLLINTEENTLKLKRIFKNMRKYKFKRELKVHKKIRSNKSSDVLKKFLLKKLSELNIKSYSIVLDKKLYKNNFLLKNNKNMEIYLKIMIKLLKEIHLDDSFDLIADSFIPRNNEKNFNKKFYECLGLSCKIHHTNSEKWVGIQATDIIAGVCLKKFRDDDSSFIEILENKHQIIKY